MEKRKLSGFDKAYIVVIVLTFVFGSIAGLTAIKQEERAMAVSFIDVGQGDCELIEFPNGKTLLIDSGEEDCYEKITVPYLREEKIGIVDIALISHFHSDHAGGILRMAEKNDMACIAAPKTEKGASIRGEILKTAKRKNIEVIRLNNTKEITLDSTVKVDVLSPSASILNNYGSNINNTSVVLKVSYGEMDFLFTGDLESEVEQVLLNSENLEAEVLKVGHHGSKSSSSVEFVGAVNPDYAVIEVGKNNRYKHPSDETLQNLDEIGARVLRTDLNGTIKFTVNKSGIKNIEVSKDEQ